MANTLELLDKKEQLTIQAKNILTAGKSESRKLSADEENAYNDLCKQIADVDKEIRDINDKLNKETNKVIKRTMSKFSLIKAVNDIANNRNLDERSQEVVNAGIAEMRKAGQSYSGQIVLPIEERGDIQATVATNGQEVVAEDKLNILEPLRANLVMAQAGATYMNGLVGNVSIPVYSGSNVGWAGEVDAATDGAGKFSEVNLEPKRLTAFIDISKQFLIQDSVSAEEMLKNDIVRAIANELEKTILGNAVGSNTKPAGVFNGVTADTTALDFKGIVDMEQALEDKNVTGNLAFIVAPNVKATLKTTLKSTGVSGYLMEGGEVDGIPVYSTSACTSKGMVLGNFSDYVIGQWGGIDLTVDPYTQAASGKVRLVINAYFDAKPRRAEAFAKKVIK